MNEIAALQPEGFRLDRYDAACRAIAEAKDVDEIKAIRNAADAMRAAARVAKNRQAEIDMAEIRMRAERRLGEMVKAQKESVGLNKGTRGQLKGKDASGGSQQNPPEDALPTLSEAGIDKNLANRARKLADMPEAEFETCVKDWREKAEAEDISVIPLPYRARVTGEVEWYTPSAWLGRARLVLGCIDLDPASSAKASEAVKAARFFTQADDGLVQPWYGSVWLNPPYEHPLIERFARKLIEEWHAGHVRAAIMLTNNSSETGWFQDLASAASAVAFPRGRLKFSGPNSYGGNALQGQSFFYFGGDVAAFARTFGDDIGVVMRRME